MRWDDVVAAMPATIVLAVFGFAKAVRECVGRGPQAEREFLPALWTLLSALALRWTHPTNGTLLVLVVPLTLLAVRTLFDVLDRRMSDRNVLAMALAAGWVFLFCQIPSLWNLPVRMRVRGFSLDSTDWLALRLGIDGMLAIGIVLVWLYRQTSASDDKRRAFFGGVVLASMFLACLPGLLQLRGRPRIDDPWSSIRQQLETTVRGGGYDLVVFVDSEASASEARLDARTAPLRFLLRTMVPTAGQRFVHNSRKLEDVLRHEGRQPVVLVTDPARRLHRSTPINLGDHTMTLTERFDSDRVIVYTPVQSRGGR
jgi:hypothetical protein